MAEDPDSPSSDSPVTKIRKWADSLLLSSPRSADQIAQMIETAHSSGIIGPGVRNIINRVIRVDEQNVGDVMIPRALMVTVSADSSLKDILKVVTDSGHSRFPVTDDNEDTVTGILLAKDILSHYPTNGDGFDLEKILRKPEFAVESTRLSAMLKTFQRTRNHMAVVVDEYGGIAGLVTIEDILEEIVGDIKDESDPEERKMIVETGKGEFSVDALTEIDEINKHFKVNINEDVDTIGGFIIKKAGKVPSIGECFPHDELNLEVTDANPRRVLELRITRLDTPATDS